MPAVVKTRTSEYKMVTNTSNNELRRHSFGRQAVQINALVFMKINEKGMQ